MHDASGFLSACCGKYEFTSIKAMLYSTGVCISQSHLEGLGSDPLQLMCDL
jgi:hypothetical protein